MTLDSFNPAAYKPEIPFGGKIESGVLNAFFDLTTRDIAKIAEILNTSVDVLKTLPVDFQPGVSNLDGTSLYVDSAAAEDKDFGLFYDSSNNRPYTVYEVLLFFMQILSNSRNAMKEGARIGSIGSKVAVGSGQSVVIPWPYADKMFEPFLFYMDGANVRPYTECNVFVNGSNLTIQNTGGNVEIWGAVWHPVLTF